MPINEESRSDVTTDIALTSSKARSLVLLLALLLIQAGERQVMSELSIKPSECDFFKRRVIL